MSVETNKLEVARAIRVWAVAAMVSFREALRIQARLTGLDLIAFTPPQPSQGDKADTPMTTGKKAVARDIQRVFSPLKPSSFKSPTLRKLVEARKYDALTALFSVPGHPHSGYKVVPFFPHVHAQKRVRGRVPKSVAAEKRATPDWKELAEYIKTVQRRVGQARGGWAAGLIKLGGRTHQWIARHVQAGTFTDALSHKQEPTFLFRNRSAWAKGGRQEDLRIIRNALTARVRNIYRDIDQRFSKLIVS